MDLPELLTRAKNKLETAAKLPPFDPTTATPREKEAYEQQAAALKNEQEARKLPLVTHTYFWICFLCYIIGLSVTVLVMYVFQAAQVFYNSIRIDSC